MKINLRLVVVYSWLSVFMTGCTIGSSKRVPVPIVPDTVKVASTDALSFTAHAKGVQIYECRAKKDDATKHEWVFKAPEADLFDARGKIIGRHYGGPTWESNDGSKVVGEVKGREPSPDAGTIPWLVLVAKKQEGSGVFSRVSAIQRLETVGGQAPVEGCEPSSMGKELRVPYTAVYYFYAPK